MFFAGSIKPGRAALAGFDPFNAAISPQEVQDLLEPSRQLPDFSKLIALQNSYPYYPRRNVINQITGWSSA